MTVEAAALRRTMVGMLPMAWGVVLGGAALVHGVAVTRVAYLTRGGYDARLATLLLVGVSAFAVAVAHAVGGCAILRSRGGRGLVAAAAVVGMAQDGLMVPVVAAFLWGVAAEALVLALACWGPGSVRAVVPEAE
jgi:hypothetical protein